MLALDALEAQVGGPSFEVVAINIDTRNADKPRQWLNDIGIHKLGYYADPTAKVFQDLKPLDAPSGCRPRCLSIRQDAKLVRWQVRRNGRALTVSRLSRPRWRNELRVDGGFKTALGHIKGALARGDGLLPAVIIEPALRFSAEPASLDIFHQ